MNPELKRNLWLDSTPFRQLIMPSAVAIFLYIAYELYDKTLGTPMAITSILTFMVIMVFWGSRSVSDSMMDEINQHTWDFQRMSAMGAWSMTWGKLVGSSFYPWLSACIALCLYIASAWHNAEATFLVKTSLILVAIAWFSLGFSLLNTLFMLRKNNKASGRQANGINLVLGIYLLAVLYPLLTNFANHSQEWYGTMYTFIDFALFTSITFTAWVIIAVYRLMRQELQYQNSPLVWLLFVLFQLFYWAGFNYGHDVDRSLILMVFSLVLTWLGLYFSDNQLTTIRRFTLSAAEKHWFAAWRYTPLWFVSYLVFIICSIAYMIHTAELSQHIFTVTCLLFVLRDIGIVLFFNTNKRFGRTDSSALIITLMLYLLLPTLVQVMNMDALVFLFVPNDIADLPTESWLQIIPAFIQAMIMWSLVIYQYRKQWQTT